MFGEIEVVSLVREAITRGAHERVAELVDAYPLEVWFGMRPDEFQLVVAEASRSRAERTGTVALFAPVFVASGIVAEPLSPEGSTGLERDLHVLAQAVATRMRGHAPEAWARVRGIGLVTDPVPRGVDPTRGLRAFALFQAGFTASLAGDLGEAMDLYAKAELCPVPKSLDFLRRHALVRHALIHALFGDRSVAERLERGLLTAGRTDSWVEQEIGAETVLLRSLLRPADEAEQAFDAIAAVDATAVGEMWPFYLLGVFRLAVIAGDHVRMLGVIDWFDRANLVGSGGPGLPGSVLCSARAVEALLDGDARRARRALRGADKDLWDIRLLAAALSLVGGRTARAVRQLEELASGTARLRQAENLRVICLAMAARADGDEELALARLRGLAPHLDPYATAALALLAPELTEAASTRLEGWPRPAATDSGLKGLRVRPTLTDREFDMLKALARGMTREQTAEALFVTVNTVKTHQRSLYRKLNANDRATALVEAQRLGLL